MSRSAAVFDLSHFAFSSSVPLSAGGASYVRKSKRTSRSAALSPNSFGDGRDGIVVPVAAAPAAPLPAPPAPAAPAPPAPLPAPPAMLPPEPGPLPIAPPAPPAP